MRGKKKGAYIFTYLLQKTDINHAVARLDKTQLLWETVDKWQQLMDSYNTMPFTSLNKNDIARDIDGVVNQTVQILHEDGKNEVM